MSSYSTKHRNTPATPDQEKKELSPMAIALQEIERMIPEIGKSLPRQFNKERMARLFTTEVRKNPLLAQCDRVSFFGAILQCSQLGLEPGSALGHAFLVPRKKKDGSYEVTLQIGYQGMLDLVERDGRITIESHLVFSNDIFDIDYGTDARIVHKPHLHGLRGDLLGAYAIARYKDGRTKFRFISVEEIEEAKKAAQAKYGPWITHYNEMARKTAVRRLYKMLPKSTDIATALDLDEKIEINEPQHLGRIVVDAPMDEQFMEIAEAAMDLEAHEAATEQK